MTDTRTCTKCGQVKPLDDFYAAARGKYGRTAQCKECKAAYHKARHVPSTRPKQRREPFTGDEIKTCTRCGESKVLTQFSLSRRATETRNAVYRPWCKECQAAAARQWFRDHPERQFAARRASSLRTFYRMTVEEYDTLLAAQGYVCAICGQDEPAAHGRTGKKFLLSVDHDHTTGRVRGLLCQKCNRAIGMLGDNPALLQRAIDYLTHPPAAAAA